MKLYTAKFAPNPRRVEIYLTEKQLDTVQRVLVDLLAGEHRSEDFRRTKNPLGLLPVLELDDGRVLTESLAICEYLEELYPEPPLIGADTWQRAKTREANRIAELGLLMGAGNAFQHTSPFFAKRFKQSPDVAANGQQRFRVYLERIDAILGGQAWLAGDTFTIADITAICAIDFGKVAGCEVPSDLPNVSRWLEAIRARPSCAIKPKP